MTPQQHARVKEIFLGACALPPERRPEFLRQECGDEAELLALAEELLRHHSEPGPDPSEQTTRDLPAGTIVADRFRIVAWLGQGGMGEVYRADDLELNAPVALKFLPWNLANDPAWLARLRAEVRVAREISHPNVCRVHDIHEADGERFISMEWVDGRDLHALLKQTGRLARDKALQVASQLCAGLAAIHAKGILHRDLKPANVMLDGRGRVRIMDLGLAAVREQIGRREISAGTPAYMSPEQGASRDVTIRSDIYALGLVLHEVFTGKEATSSQSERESSARIGDHPCSPDVEEVISRCLSLDPADRPGSAMEVAAALHGGDALAASLAAGELPSPTLLVSGPTGRVWTNRQLIGIAAATVVLLGLLSTALAGAHPLVSARFRKPPPVMAERARELLFSAGFPRDCGFEAYGLAEAPLELPEALDQAMKEGTSELGSWPAVLFWYRCSPRPLAAANPMRLVFGGARVTPADPAPIGPGEALVLLDEAGEVVWFQESTGSATTGSSARPGTPTQSSGGGRAADAASRRARVYWAQFIVVLALLLTSLPLAIRHRRLGRIDASAATRLAAAVFGLRLVASLLEAAHPGTAFEESRILVLAAVGALAEAAAVWLFYQALEPLVRRYWPHALVTWARVLAGRMSDPAVGQHLLIGVLLGAFWSAAVRLSELIPRWLGIGSRDPLRLEGFFSVVTSTREAAGGVLEAVRDGAVYGLGLFLLIALLRAKTRWPVLAGTVAAGVFSLLLIPRGTHLLISAGLLGLALAGVAVWATLRFGLLPPVVGFTVMLLLIRAPLTMDLRAWYAEPAMVALVVVLVLGGYGLWSALRAGMIAERT